MAASYPDQVGTPLHFGRSSSSRRDPASSPAWLSIAEELAHPRLGGCRVSGLCRCLLCGPREVSLSPASGVWCPEPAHAGTQEPPVKWSGISPAGSPWALLKVKLYELIIK